ncbi:MAG: adenosylcobinamide-GDP ribazoletransferase [Gordonia sp. (in: high G+C Gram-positive bacteria)]
MAPEQSGLGAAHMSPLRAVHTAFSWLTVAPLPQPRGDVSRAVGGAAIAAVPGVGIVLGAVVAAFGFGFSFSALPAPLVGVLAVALLAVATRGMHLDGLADTADGLGCYGDAERVREVMRSGSLGPFGAATLVLALAVQAIGLAVLIQESRWYTAVFVIALSRVSAVIACRRSIAPANADGFGSLVAGTQRYAIAGWLVVALVAAPTAARLDDPSWSAAIDVVAPLVAVVVVAAFAYVFTAHCARRMGGMNGDVLGASIELSLALALVVVLF